jgi:hypothetical protein
MTKRTDDGVYIIHSVHKEVKVITIILIASTYQGLTSRNFILNDIGFLSIFIYYIVKNYCVQCTMSPQNYIESMLIEIKLPGIPNIIYLLTHYLPRIKLTPNCIVLMRV